MRSKLAVGALGILHRGVFFLLREGIGIQPVQQLHVHSQSPEGKLRRMDMQVGDAGDDQPVAVIHQRQRGKTLRERLKHAGTAAVNADKPAVRYNADMVGIFAVTEVPAKDIVLHVPFPPKVDTCL